MIIIKTMESFPNHFPCSLPTAFTFGLKLDALLQRAGICVTVGPAMLRTCQAIHRSTRTSELELANQINTISFDSSLLIFRAILCTPLLPYPETLKPAPSTTVYVNIPSSHSKTAFPQNIIIDIYIFFVVHTA